jgi:hypothetical protein
MNSLQRKSPSRKSSVISLTKPELEKDEIEYFETELNRLDELFSVPYMTRRDNLAKDDVLDELMEVH